MFVIERRIMLARAAACASERRSMIGTPAPRGARPRARTRGHLGLTIVVIRGDVVGIDNVVAMATELVVVVSQLERRVIGEGTAGTERVVVVRQLLRRVIFKSAATERVVVAMERLEVNDVCELPHANAIARTMHVRIAVSSESVCVIVVRPGGWPKGGTMMIEIERQKQRKGEKKFRYCCTRSSFSVAGCQVTSSTLFRPHGRHQSVDRCPVHAPDDTAILTCMVRAIAFSCGSSQTLFTSSRSRTR